MGEYCVLKSETDPKHLTVLVLRLFPFKLFYAIAVPAKVSHPEVATRLASFIKDIGLMICCYRSDTEPAICSMIEDACAKAGRTRGQRGMLVESASNSCQSTRKEPPRQYPSAHQFRRR